MTIEPQQVVAMMDAANVSVERMARHLDRPPSAIQSWRDGTGRAPQYLALTLEAIRRGLQPASVARMIRIDVAAAIGVPASSARYWRLTRQYPIAARFAVAAVDDAKKATSHDVKVLRNIRTGRYYQTHTGWRALPVLGKAMPTISREKVRSLLGAGLVSTTGRYLSLTPKGLDTAYAQTD